MQNEALLEEKFGALLHDVLIALVGAASGAADVLLGVEPVDDCCSRRLKRMTRTTMRLFE